MSKFDLSINNVYPYSEATMSTTEQSIPTHTEENYAIDSETTTDSNGQTAVNKNKNQIMGGFILLVGVMFFLHCID